MNIPYQILDFHLCQNHPVLPLDQNINQIKNKNLDCLNHRVIKNTHDKAHHGPI